MRSTQQFCITLPHEMADAVRAKVAVGEYTAESDRQGLIAYAVDQNARTVSVLGIFQGGQDCEAALAAD